MNQVLEMELQFLIKNLKSAVQAAVGSKALNLVTILKQVEAVAQSGSQHAAIITTAVQSLESLHDDVQKLFDEVQGAIAKNKAVVPASQSVAQSQSQTVSDLGSEKTASAPEASSQPQDSGLVMRPHAGESNKSEAQ
jgi:hypothetical protein